MKEMTDTELDELLGLHTCPDCHNMGFLKGPEGGLSTNIKCKTCGSEFNVCPPHFAERIPPLKPLVTKKEKEDTMINDFTLIGHLSQTEPIYRTTDGKLAIEKDFEYLVEATPEEKSRILEIFPHLKPKPVEAQPSAYALFILSMALLQAASRPI
jgi:hypothetical protein